jgi:nitroreductase
LQQINGTALAAMKNSGNEFLMSRANLPGYQPLHGAPALALVFAPDGLISQANTACAATAMIFAAVDVGLGSCCVVSPTLALDGGNALSARLHLPGGFKPVCGVLLGYAGKERFPAHGEKADNINFVG